MVQSIRYQYWTNLPEVATGTRVVRINLTRLIPCFVKMNNYCCKVWYHGQPVYCDISKADTHLASSCPFKGKCLSCEGVGHLARHCPTVCFSVRVATRRTPVRTVTAGNVGLLMKTASGRLLLISTLGTLLLLTLSSSLLTVQMVPSPLLPVSLMLVPLMLTPLMRVSLMFLLRVVLFPIMWVPLTFWLRVPPRCLPSRLTMRGSISWMRSRARKSPRASRF